MTHEPLVLLRPPFDEEDIVREVRRLVWETFSSLGRELSGSEFSGACPSLSREPIQSPLDTDVRRLVWLVNDLPNVLRDRCLLEELAGKYTSVASMLTKAPAINPQLRTVGPVPTKYKIGSVLRWAEAYLYDDLISYTRAAEILYLDHYGERNAPRAAAVARIRRLVESGVLSGYVDLGEANPRHAQRVRRADVEQLRDTMPAERRQKPRKSTTRQLNVAGEDYRLGESIRHSHFGEGRVVGVREDAGDVHVSVHFPQLGEKTFKASLARLERL